jgi:hypothetical protein
LHDFENKKVKNVNGENDLTYIQVLAPEAKRAFRQLPKVRILSFENK